MLALLLDLGLRNRVWRRWPFTYISRLDRLALQHRADGRIHHQLGQPHGALIQCVNSGPDCLVVFFPDYGPQSRFLLVDARALTGRKLFPSGIPAALFQCRQDRLGLIARLD